VPFDINPEGYDLIFIGTPVWAWEPAPPLKTFFSTCNISNKKSLYFANKS